MDNVLLVDDDPDIVKLNKKYLSSKGYNIFTADCGESAMQVVNENVLDCIVLDVLLPDILGFDLCKKIREICNAPIIFLSCKDQENDKITGFLSGGDDYMAKPFSMRELEVRIRAQIRRASIVVLDSENKIVLYRSKSVLLSQVEFEVFQFLYNNQNRCIPSLELYAMLSGGEKDASNTIAVYIRRLRKKFEVFGEAFKIETVRYEGYKFIEK